MTRQKKIGTDRDWLIKHLTPLMDAGKDLMSKSNQFPVKFPTYDKGYWAGLKLILEKYYLKPYLNIQGKRGLKLAYVDLFAGPGLDLIGDRKVPIPGSPLIPIMIRETDYQFSAFIFSEIEEQYINALKKRVELFPSIENITKILAEDANVVIHRLPDTLRSYDINHSLVFIDPEGMELKWTSLEYLANNVECDLIINFPSSGLHRNLHNPSVIPKIKEFLGLGSDNIPSNADEQWAIQIYRNKLATTGKDISTEIVVRSGNAFHYHLIPAVKTTYGGSPWFQAFIDAKQKIEGFTGDVLGVIADQIEGRMGSLDDAVRKARK